MERKQRRRWSVFLSITYGWICADKEINITKVKGANMRHSFHFLFILAIVNYPVIINAQIERIPFHNNNAFNPELIIPFSQAQGYFEIVKERTDTMDFDSTLAQRLQQAIVKSKTEGGFYGVSAALMLPGKGMWKGATGISSDTPLVSLTPEMAFNITSNTKTFTATMIMKLVEQGKLSLDDSIQKYLPPINHVPGNITIRQLLNHTSGLFDFINDNFSLYYDSVYIKNPSRRWTPLEALQTFLGPPKHLPGEKYRYTNTGLIIAGMIIEKAANMKVSEFLRSHILDSLQLASTFFTPDDSITIPVAYGWTKFFSNSEPFQYMGKINNTAQMSSLFTAGAIYSTLEDFTRWTNNFYTGQVLKPSSMEEVFTLIPTNSSLPEFNIFHLRYDSVGLGVRPWYFYNDIKLWGHNGFWRGYSSNSLYIPETGATITAFVNTTTNYYSVLRALNDLLTAYFRTYKPSLSVNTQDMEIKANNGQQYWDTTFVIKNIGGAMDSVFITAKPSTTEPDSTYTIFPSAFALQPNDSQIVTFRINTAKWPTRRNHVGRIHIDSKLAYDVRHWEKQFVVVYTLDVDDKNAIPREYSLSQNYPNPFNPSTLIRFTLQGSGFTSLIVYDLLGREVATLVNEQKDAGSYEVMFDGQHISSGMYFYQLRSGEFAQTRKLVLQK